MLSEIIGRIQNRKPIKTGKLDCGKPHLKPCAVLSAIKQTHWKINKNIQYYNSVQWRHEENNFSKRRIYQREKL